MSTTILSNQLQVARAVHKARLEAGVRDCYHYYVVSSMDPHCLTFLPYSILPVSIEHAELFVDSFSSHYARHMSLLLPKWRRLHS